MQINVVQAIGGGEISLQCEKTDSVAAIKERVAQQKRIPARSVILVFQGKQLDESETLKSAGIEDMDKLYMITRTTGGFS
ncbi:MAG: ubiquitin family protein [Candidatus Hodarchaeales archaeon]|jgi:ubiquitin-like protein Nedd8